MVICRVYFFYSSVIQIYKKPHANCSDSYNFRGIVLGSTFCRIFDDNVLEKFRDELSTSGRQFAFKHITVQCTRACTMVLKETVSHDPNYTKSYSFVFCTFLDATRAFHRVNFCKLFHLLLKRGLLACLIHKSFN
jgi:hypothetical protein